jgi:transposase
MSNTAAGSRLYFYQGSPQVHPLPFKMSKLQEQATAGGVLVVAPVQAAYETAVGRPVHHAVVYRALHRQGWRKVMPRPKHPKANEEVREAFKKTYRNSFRSK